MLMATVVVSTKRSELSVSEVYDRYRTAPNSHTIMGESAFLRMRVTPTLTFTMYVAHRVLLGEASGGRCYLAGEVTFVFPRVARYPSCTLSTL